MAKSPISINISKLCTWQTQHFLPQICTAWSNRWLGLGPRRPRQRQDGAGRPCARLGRGARAHRVVRWSLGGLTGEGPGFFDLFPEKSSDSHHFFMICSLISQQNKENHRKPWFFGGCGLLFVVFERKQERRGSLVRTKLCSTKSVGFSVRQILCYVLISLWKLEEKTDISKGDCTYRPSLEFGCNNVWTFWTLDQHQLNIYLQTRLYLKKKKKTVPNGLFLLTFCRPKPKSHRDHYGSETLLARGWTFQQRTQKWQRKFAVQVFSALLKEARSDPFWNPHNGVGQLRSGERMQLLRWNHGLNRF